MYGFYTNKSIDNIFSSWGKKIASINYKYKRDSFRDEEFLFCLGSGLSGMGERLGSGLSGMGEPDA
ncbi:hypothetical protein LTSEJOH_0546 [Salmonella enterica subsp. enterica serovar Johannesburg str. S5-703]|nr:hypothetical protein LTSEJOH_0546 [Salmonella enterica subsp. enterica serovar Johannesburg str. S5-703]